MLSGATTPDDSSSFINLQTGNVIVLGAQHSGRNKLVAKILQEGGGQILYDEGDADFQCSELMLPFTGENTETPSTIRFAICESSTLSNHSTLLKAAYKKADYVLFVFDITSRSASFHQL